jgi:hypothetical protein
MVCKIEETSKKIIKNQVQRFFRPISIHTCHQKPNTARETVPLKIQIKNLRITCLPISSSSGIIPRYKKKTHFVKEKTTHSAQFC